jgi:ATPase AAA-2 domain protein
MLERSKWQRELLVFSRLVNTVVLTGNINDQHPIVNEREQKIQGFCSLEVYLARTCQSLGYQAVLFYNPIDGFYIINGLQQKIDVLELAENTVKAVASGQGNGQNGSLGLTKRKSTVGNDSLFPESIEDAAHIVNLLLTHCDTTIAVIVSFSSRMTARPDDLDMNERFTFMHFHEGALNARKNHAGDPSSQDFQNNPMIQNQLFLIADKINDLPAWYYLSHPSLKNINIPKPDYRMRGQIITGYAANFPGYKEATDDERKLFNEVFVGSTESFTTQDIARVFQIAKFSNLDIHGIDKAILLYKHGVQDNPWLKLDAKKLAGAEEQIKKRVLGQDVVVKAAVDIVKRAAMGMSGLQHSSSSSKPRGILFLAGPTGTGKTELAKALTELIFLDERNMIRFDMSEYRQEQSDQRLLGAPPGYVGYEAGGQLTNAVREHPFSVLLFDEIEKAHPSVMDKFLQVLEDGRITDGRGDTVYFQDCLIIFTSNLGITIPSPDNPGVRVQNVSYETDKDYQTVKGKILHGVRHYFNDELGRPELLNRIGNNILVFDYIREDSLKPILTKQINSIARNLWSDKHIQLIVNESAEDNLFKFAVDDLPKGQGGRGIGNMMEEVLINPLARFMFDNSVTRDTTVTVEGIYKKDGIAQIKARIG